MKAAMSLFAVLALLVAGCAHNQPRMPSTTALDGLAPGTHPLFIIERNKNANVVHYDVRIGSDGKLDPKEPVIAYFVMAAEDGRREELNWVERKMAYGFDIEPDSSSGGYKMTMVAVPQQSIVVKKVGNAIRAELAIDGQPAILEKMYIDATDGLTGTTVNYIQVYGKDLKTGKKRFEKVMPK